MDGTSESTGDQLPDRRAAHLERFQFKPGQSGNPGGRPKGRTLMGVLRELLEQEELSGQACPPGKQVIDLVGEAFLWECLRRGNATLLKELLDRTDGKVLAKLEVEGELTIKVEYADDFAEAPPATSGATGDPEGSEAV